MSSVRNDSDLDTRGADALRFASILWPETASGYVEFRFLGRDYPRQRWYRRDTELPQFTWPWFLSRMDAYDIFVGLALRREHGSGGRANCAETWTLVVDFDGKDVAGARRFERVLSEFPLEPTMIVRSGSPFARHLYWRLTEPIVFVDEGAAVLYSRAIRGLAEHFGGDPAVADIPRIIRLPGSRNHKSAAEGAVVALDVYRPGRSYNLTDFDPWLAAPAPPRPTGGQPHAGCQEGDVDLVTEFTQRGWLLQDQGSEMYFVRCPWAEQHSSRSGVSESRLWAWEGRWHYRCMHAHCTGRRVAALYEYFRLMREAARMVG